MTIIGTNTPVREHDFVYTGVIKSQTRNTELVEFRLLQNIYT